MQSNFKGRHQTLAQNCYLLELQQLSLLHAVRLAWKIATLVYTQRSSVRSILSTACAHTHLTSNVATTFIKNIKHVESSVLLGAVRLLEGMSPKNGTPHSQVTSPHTACISSRLKLFKFELRLGTWLSVNSFMVQLYMHQVCVHLRRFYAVYLFAIVGAQ